MHTEDHELTYAGADDVSLDDVAWYFETATKTQPVGTAGVEGVDAANALGLFDMSGNVREWCWDWFGDYSAEPQMNPTAFQGNIENFAGDSFRVFRGGSFFDFASSCRVAHRLGIIPSKREQVIGFRFVRASVAK